MKKILISIALFFAVVMIPEFAQASWFDLGAGITDVQGKLKLIGKLLTTLAVIIFLWGIVKFIWQDKKDEGKTNMIWGIIGLFVLFTFWGIITFIQKSTINNNPAPIPSPVITI